MPTKIEMLLNFLIQLRCFAIKLIAIVTISFMVCQDVSGQIQVSPGVQAPFSVESLIKDVFQGEGVDILNVTFNGDTVALGYFDSALNDIGIDKGLLLSNGSYTQIARANAQSSSGTAHTLMPPATDMDLTTLTMGTVSDVVKIEIEFVPKGDEISFRYVFGSEEYPEFGCATAEGAFFDAFGLFLSGDGISGGMGFENDAVNLAMLPNGQPVTVETVHPTTDDCPGANEGFYNDNTGSPNLELDGFVDMMTARSAVTPCMTYKLKIVIGDVGRQAGVPSNINDSVIFLEQSSLSSNETKAERVTFNQNGIIQEGCEDASLVVNLSAPLNATYVANYTVGGTATLGIDYDLSTSGFLSIPGGRTSGSIEITPIPDNDIEGPEDFWIALELNCEPDTFFFTIDDNSAVQPYLGRDETICVGDSVKLYSSYSPIVSEDQVFVNNQSVPIINARQVTMVGTVVETVKSTLEVSGAVPEVLGPGVINSVCIDINHLDAGDLNIFLRAPGGAFIKLTTHNGDLHDGFDNVCFVPDPAAELISNPGEIRTSYLGAGNLQLPITGTYQPEGDWSNLWIDGSPTNGTWELIVFDDKSGGFELPESIESFEITFNPPFDVEYTYNTNAGLTCVGCPDPWAKPTATTTYELTVSDNNGCMRSDEITISVLSEIAAPIPLCASPAPNDLLVRWDNSPGASGYMIEADILAIPVQGNQADTAHLFTGLDPGQIIDITITPLVEAGSNCAVRDTSFQCQVAECEPITIVMESVSSPLCFGGTDGSLSVSATSSVTTVFNYAIPELGKFSATGSFGLLEAGTYEVMAEGDGCFGSVMVTIPEQPGIVTTMTKINDPLCPAQSSARARVEVTGGAVVGTYAYLWSNNTTAATLDDVLEGKYYVTVTDDNNCHVVDSIEFIDPEPYMVTVSATPITCNGAMDGTGTAIASNGVEPYSFIWSNTAGGQMTSTATGLPSGMHSVFVSDGNNCPQTRSIEITERDAIQVTVVPIDATCNGIDDGQASVTEVIGGAGGYEYLWNDDAMSTTEDIVNVPVGDAIVTVTDSDGCSVVATASVQSPPAMTLTINTAPVVCSGGTDGQATVTVSGGAGNYIYEWSDSGPASSMRTDLTSGSNIVTVTDANGCKEIEEFFLASENPIMSNLDSTEVSCFGGNDGSVTLVATGGTGTLDILWDDPAVSTTATVNNLAAGTYRVTIEDVNDCYIVDSIEVTQPDPIQLSSSAMDIDCNGDADGQASVNVDNGFVVDNYSWNDPMGQSTPTAINLDGGTYRAVVTYNGICLDSIDVEVSEPEVLIINMSKTDIGCDGETNGTATATVTGGILPYSYVWNDMLNQTDMTAVDLVAQSYTVSVTDGNLCPVMASIEVVEPAKLEVGDMESSNVDCFDTATGMARFTPAGGVAPYTYAWSDGMSTDSTRSDLLPQKYYITITDNSLCSIIDSVDIQNKPGMTFMTDSTRVTCFGGDDGTATVVASGGNGGFMYQWDDPLSQAAFIANTLSAGTYKVVVTDALGCMDSTEVEVTQNNEILISGDVADVSCFGLGDGIADASATGGTGSLRYQWSDPANTMSATLFNVPAGGYVVSVTDDLSCIDTLRFIVGEPDTLAVTFVVDGLLCFGDALGSITANVTGGNGTPGDPSRYSYQWDDPLSQVTEEAEGLMVGIYSVSVSDSRNCITVDTVRLIEPEALTLQLEATDILCNGAATGSINSTVTGGTLDYMYSYTGGITEADPNGLLAGMYTVTVTDANGCEIIDDIEIVEPSAIVVETMKEDIDCFGNQNGAIDVNTSGGVGSYDFAWSSGQVVEDILNLSAGNYTLTVTDDNNCDQLTTITIVSPSEIQANINRTNVACFGDVTGAASINVTGGAMPYDLEWSNGELVDNIVDLAAGTYYVSIEDNNGCEVLDSVEITQPAAGIMATPTTVDLTCFGDNNGTIDLDVSGGSGTYQFQLSGQAISNNPIFQGLSGGIYEVTVIDQNGCTLVVPDINVFEPGEIFVDLGGNKIIELGIDTVQLNPAISGGQGGLTYEYTGSNLDNLTCTACPNPFIDGQVFTKEYTLTVTDQAGCMNSDKIIVVISKDRRVWVPTGFTPNADNSNDLLTPLGDPNTMVINFQIFDRWGTLVFDQSDFQLGDTAIGWDGSYKGQDLDTGVFVWKAEVVYFEDGVRENFTGQTYLLR